jgi:hypothetical protein
MNAEADDDKAMKAEAWAIADSKAKLAPRSDCFATVP